MTARKTAADRNAPETGTASTQAAITEPSVTAAGEVSRFGATSGWLIPSTMRLYQSSPTLLELVYTNEQPHPRVQAEPGLLDGFLRLETAADDAILAYARRWGPLWLCEAHDLPYRHNPQCQTYRDAIPPTEEELEFASRPDQKNKFHFATSVFAEAVAGWRALSTQMRATLRIARRLHDGLTADDADWDALPFLRRLLVELVVPGLEDAFSSTEDRTNIEELERIAGLSHEAISALVRQEFKTNPPPEPRSPHGEEHEVFWEAYFRLCDAIGRQRMRGSVDYQRQVLSAVLNDWLSLAGVRPRLEWTTRNPQMQLGGDGLMGTLAVQLFFACAQTGGLALCASCGTPFLPSGRRRRKDLNAYCSECGLKAALRDAAARYRQTAKYRTTNTRWRDRRSGRGSSDEAAPSNVP